MIKQRSIPEQWVGYLPAEILLHWCCNRAR
uniref:Uncharacterized protein n=1 Tax=Anguilla anguilla TaxID=7936 RepID=A0A0E9UHI2_ANGAN